MFKYFNPLNFDILYLINYFQFIYFNHYQDFIFIFINFKLVTNLNFFLLI